MNKGWNKYRTLWQAMKGQRLRYVLAVGFLFANVQCSAMIPLIVRTTVDSIIGDKPLERPTWMVTGVEHVGGAEAVRQHLWIPGAAMVAIALAAGIFGYLRPRFTNIASENISRRLRDRLYDHLQHLPVAYHDKADAGDLIQRCTSDVEQVRGFLAGQIIDIMRAVFLICVVVPLLLWLNPWMALVALAGIPAIVVFSVIFFSRIRGAFKKADEAEGAMTTQLQENLTGIRVVRAFARQEFESEKFAARNGRFRDLQRRLIGHMSIYWASTDLLTLAQTGAVVMLGTYWVSTGNLSVGDLMAFMAYVAMISWPIRQMGRVLTDLSKTTVSLSRLDDILSAAAEDKAAPGVPLPVRAVPTGEHTGGQAASATRAAEPNAPPAPAAGHITVQGLAFSHDDNGHALQGVSFEVQPGQTLAIMGPSGSGKSTLVHLLVRLYDYRTGSIRIDGRELKDLGRKEARSLFGVVMQEPFLYSKTIRDNIRLGAGSHVGDDEVQQAAVLACIHDNIKEFEKGYDTLVGERGVTLSGGQRQRMALARAILKDPPVLILDDALSAVDTETETMILEALTRRHSRRTTLVIAHRLSTLRAADTIIVLDAGRITQAGTHEQLLRQDGLYRRLWQIQSSVEESLDEEIRSTPSSPRPAQEEAGGAAGALA
jgi:ATP-binding cassette, subfamily B, bacterial